MKKNTDKGQEALNRVLGTELTHHLKTGHSPAAGLEQEAAQEGPANLPQRL